MDYFIVSLADDNRKKHRQSTVDEIHPWMATRTGKAKTKTKHTNEPEQQKKSPGSLLTNTNKTYFVKTAETARDSKANYITCRLVDGAVSRFHDDSHFCEGHTLRIVGRQY